MSFVVGNFNFTILSGTTAELAGFVNATGVTTLTNIPATATDPSTSITYNVIGISDSAFVDNALLQTIVIPGTIQYTGRITFGTNAALTSLTLGEGITTIGRGASPGDQSVCFASCSALTNLVIPASVTTIGEAAFLNCSGLTNIRFNSTTTLPAINTNAFSGGQAGIIIQYRSSVTNLNSVTTQSGTQALSAFFNSPVIAAPCFKEGSKILTDSGYKLVQNLRKGDLVKTSLNGYKPISLIGKREIYHTASEERIKDQLYKYSSKKTSEVFEDLVITGAHSVLVDDISEEQREKISEVLGKIYVTDKKYRLPACVDKRSSVYEAAGTYTIYHFALDCEDSRANYGVYANGLLVETCSKRYLTDFSNMELI